MVETKGKYKNFDIFYGDAPLEDIIEAYAKKGGKVKDLIAAVDGFHPS